jgi:hypothetical protein
MVAAARKTGNSGLIESTLKSRQETRATQTEADRAEFNERKLGETERHNREAEDLQAQRIEKALGKSNGSSSEALKYIHEARVGVNQRQERLQKMMDSEIKEAMTPKAKAAVRETYKAKFDALETEAAQLSSDFKVLKERVLSGEPPVSTSGNASPKTSGKGDPASGSGLIASTEQSPDAKLKELQAQFDVLMARQSDPKTASQSQAESLQGIENQINALKRQPSGNTASGSKSGREVGTTQVVASGPHKGKTAVWDGTGWALK